MILGEFHCDKLDAPVLFKPRERVVYDIRGRPISTLLTVSGIDQQYTSRRCAACKLPIKLAGAAIERTRLQNSLVDPRYRRHFGVFASGKNLGSRLKNRNSAGWSRAQWRRARGAGQLPESADAGEIGAARLRREDDTIFRHEEIGRAEFGDVAQHIAQQTIVEAARTRPDRRVFG
jgi:hypothetical protein